MCPVQNYNTERYVIYLNGMTSAQGPIERIYPADVSEMRVGMSFDGDRPYIGSLSTFNLWNIAFNEDMIREIQTRPMDLFEIPLWTTAYESDACLWQTMEDPDLNGGPSTIPTVCPSVGRSTGP